MRKRNVGSLVSLLSLFASAIAATGLLNVASCSMGHIGDPTLGTGTGGDGGTNVDGGVGPLPFAADSPNIYLAKVKNVLVGLPPTDQELQTVTADPTQLGTLVDGWMKLPEYQTKMMRFFELAFQQTQVAATDFADMLDNGQLQLRGPASGIFLQSLEESFARTMLNANSKGQPFNQAMTTQTYAMTTALKVFYALLDVWQVDDTLNGIHDGFQQANAGKSIYLTAKGPIPLTESIDPASANYMHWYNPDVATIGGGPTCQTDPIVYPARANTLYDIIVGIVPSRKGNGGMCPGGGGGNIANGQLKLADYSDWTTVNIRQPNGNEKRTDFYDLQTLRGGSDLVLKRPYVGFFTTPAFFANWQTNTSNQMRVTINQTLIVATGAQIDGTDSTTPTSTPGLDATHASNPKCFICHQLLDPTRSIFASTFSWNYGTQLDSQYASQPGLFAFQGVQANVSSIYDFGKTLASHPLLASGWAQKLCYYIDSEACEPNDPEFQNVVKLFTTSNYSWDQLVKALVISPITTHESSTLTATTNGEIVGVERRDHLCAAWNARLGFTDLCGLDATKNNVLNPNALAIVGGLPSDGYGRGSVAPVLPNHPSLFFRAATENLCEAIALLVVDPVTKPPAGAKTWTSAQSDVAIGDFVGVIMGLVPSDPRATPAKALLQAHFTAAKQQGLTPTDGLQSTFTAACMSPSAVSMGM